VNFIDIFLLNINPALSDTNNYGNFGKAIIAGLVWIPFFVKSEKCKRIFIK
jgi:hypothetical protein